MTKRLSCFALLHPAMALPFVLLVLALTTIAACGDDSPGHTVGDKTPDGGVRVNPDGGVIEPPPPYIASVSVANSDAAQIRQGSGGEPTKLAAEIHVEGDSLDGATRVMVGDIEGAIQSATPKNLTFTVLVPHGSPLGAQPVRVTNKRGTGSLDAAVTITPITASPYGVDKGDGTGENPFRTVKQALLCAAAGDTVVLKNGIYDSWHGDNFVPADPWNRNLKENVRAGVTLKGESATETKLVGSGQSDCGAPAAKVGLVLGPNARVETLNVSKFCIGIYSRVENAALRGESAHEKETRHQTPVVAGDTFAGANAPGMALSDTANFLGIGGYLSRNYSVVSGLKVNNVDVNSNPSNGRRVGGADGSDPISAATVTIRNVNSHDNYYGVTLEGISYGIVPTFTVADSIFKDDYYGLEVLGNWDVKIRSSILQSSLISVRLVEAGGRSVDLGTSSDLGRNTFTTMNVGIMDERIPTSPGSVPIRITGNTWTGAAAPPSEGCSSEVSSPPLDPSFPYDPKNWRVLNPGTCPATGNVVIN
ncbi:DUF1565 domain-containing protein [Pendulispora brunnea]|uniref:DUF1565 domain-containing protein n=1 Tax=Pendulispora brunnea TaxID=2905690 RepID=A0ABZ2K3A2_9BACT